MGRKLIDWSDKALQEQIEQLVRDGKTNVEICKILNVPNGYSSVVGYCGKLRKALGITLKRHRRTAEDMKADIQNELDDYVEDNSSLFKVLSSASNSVDVFNNFVLDHLNSGFTDRDMNKMELYSKQIGSIIDKLENVQFLFDNITSMRGDKK